MDSPSQYAIRAFEALAAGNEQLAALTRRLRERPGVESAQHSLDARWYESGPMIEMYVEVELSNGKAMVWGVDLRWDSSQWLIQCFARANDREGQFPLHEFRDRSAITFDEMLVCVRQALDALLTGAEQTDLASL
jgi:hypothetical protein